MNNATRAAHSLARRHRAEARFRWYGRGALAVAFVMLAVLLGSLLGPAIHGLRRDEVELSVRLPAQGLPDLAATGRFIREAWKSRCTTDRADDTRGWLRLLAPGYEKEAYAQLGTLSSSDHSVRLPLSGSVRGLLKDRNATGAIPACLETLHRQDALHRSVDWGFLTRGDSRFPEKAGMLASLVGSLFVLAVTMGLAFPIGIGAAIYLEEFARKGRLRDIIEVNINNLAAVPSIVFGLLGLAMFLNTFSLPRSSSLAGGLTLALMTLPMIIITARAALAAVPPSIRQGALALGASPLQVVWQHTLPLAMPGILTGTILGMARAIGETAPLLMIGMAAFIADAPHTPTDAATAMPVEIYLWASSPEAGFANKTAAGILMLLVILMALNALAIVLRRRYERRW